MKKQTVKYIDFMDTKNWQYAHYFTLKDDILTGFSFPSDWLGNCYEMDEETRKKWVTCNLTCDYHGMAMWELKDKNMKTPVIFRTWLKAKRYPDVIAIFPTIAGDSYGFYPLSYEHVGQHGQCDYTGILPVTRLAKEEEYKPLKDELESIGYNLKVYKKEQYWMVQKRRDAAKNLF